MSGILVTGATGFIGRRLIDRLRHSDLGHVFTLTRRVSDCAGTTNIVCADFSLPSLMAATARIELDFIVHLAASGVDPWERDLDNLVRVNTVAPATMVSLGAHKNTKAIVLAGSSAEYSIQNRKTRLSEQSSLGTTGLYGATKAAGGLLSLAAAQALGQRAAHLRIFNAYGPGEAPHRLLPSLVSALARNDDVLLSPATQVRDFIHVDDVCEGVISALLGLSSGGMECGAYNLGTGMGHTVREFSEIVCSAMRRPLELLRFGAIPMRTDDQPYVVADISLLQETGWRVARPFQESVVSAISELCAKDYRGVIVG